MELKFELKYCEMCGALGLRRPQSSQTYCEACARRLTTIALPHRRPPQPANAGRQPAAPSLQLEVTA